MIRAVLFDFDGVLTTDATGTLSTTRHLSRISGIDRADVERAYRRHNHALTVGHITHRDMWAAFCADLGVALPPALLTQAFLSTPLCDAMLALAARLRPRYRVGIVTDNKQDRIDTLDAHHRLSAQFDPIVVSARVGSGKDQPAIFVEALRRLGLDAQACVFIDNRPDNLVAAAHLGLHTLHFDDRVRDMPQLIGRLRALGVEVPDV